MSDFSRGIVLGAIAQQVFDYKIEVLAILALIVVAIDLGVYLWEHKDA